LTNVLLAMRALDIECDVENDIPLPRASAGAASKSVIAIRAATDAAAILNVFMWPSSCAPTCLADGPPLRREHRWAAEFRCSLRNRAQANGGSAQQRGAPRIKMPRPQGPGRI